MTWQIKPIGEVFRVVNVAELDEHLQLHELLLDGRVIHELLFHDALDLA